MFTFCSLYLAQGIPFGFMAVTLPAYITDAGVSRLAVSAALVMTTLPYTFKWIWGPTMDLVTIPALGRRRPWILFAQLMMAATVLAMLALDVTADLEALALLIFVHAVFNSMQDVAVDALAIDLLDHDERGRANGLMYACKYLGVIVGGAGMGRLVAAYDIPAALIVQTAILLAIFVLTLLVRERSGPPIPRPPAHEILDGLGQAATLRTTLVVACVMLCLTVTNGVLAVGSPELYLGELAWPVEQYTDLAGGLAYAGGFGGSILGGFLADIVGRRRLLALASIGMALGWLVFAVAKPIWDVDGLIYPLAIWGAVCQSMMIVSSFALCMDATWSRIAATHFAAYMALSALSTTLGYRLAPIVFEHLSFQNVFFAAAAMQVAVTALLVLARPGEVQRKLPLAPGWRFNAIGILTALLVVVALGIVPIVLFVY
jgi:MFS transporter, PAT family, beta-lactamase induction signal transducer AmpG